MKASTRVAHWVFGNIWLKLLSLGLAINRRSLRASAFGASLEADGGETVETKAARHEREINDELD